MILDTFVYISSLAFLSGVDEFDTFCLRVSSLAFLSGFNERSFVMLDTFVYISSLAFLSGVDESWERFSGFLSILWLPKQEQYEINVLRMISCRLLLPIHRVIFEENINQKKMCNSCLTVSK